MQVISGGDSNKDLDYSLVESFQVTEDKEQKYFSLSGEKNY